MMLRAITASLVVVLAGDKPVGSDRLTVDYAITNMSVIGPELHVVVENHAAEARPFWVNPRVSATAESESCLKRQPRRTSDPPAPIWEARRELPNGQQGGMVPALGIAHRVYGLSNLNVDGGGCRFVLEVMTENDYQEFQLNVDRPPRARPLMTDIPPAVETRIQVEKDIVEYRLLVRVIVRNPGAAQFNVAIIDRRLVCAQPGQAAWHLLEDVPQGLSSGPGRLGPYSWIGFVNVVRVASVDSASQCTAEFELVYEAFPMAYVPLGVVSAPLKPEGRLIWSRKKKS